MLCPRCGSSVPEEFPVCGSCGYDLSAPQSGGPGDAGDTDRYVPISGPLELREVGQDERQAGLPYATGDIVNERYQIDQVVAEGPVGVVYSAVDLDMDVQIALKVVLSEYFPDHRALSRFKKTVEPARELSHENIVRIYELASEESRFIIAQQMIVGRTLAEVLAERLPQGIRSPADEVQALLTRIGEALAYTHPDTVHGALKPSNILILPAGLVITDFCLAVALDREAYIAGHRHRRLPTRYLAPEYLAGRAVDHRSDLYSLAVIAFELLAGIPYPGDRDRAASAMDDLHPAARGTLLETLSRSPGNRPDHVDDLLDGVMAAVIEGTPTDQHAVGDSTNVLDISDLEMVDDDQEPIEDDSPIQEDFDKTVPRKSLGSTRKAPRGLGFTIEPRTAEDIPPAFDSGGEPMARPVGGRRADPEGMIETAEDVEDLPNIDVDGKRPRGRGSAGLDRKDSRDAKRPRKVTDAIEAMDFDATLENALASAASVPPLPKQKKRRRPRKKGPGIEPDPEAMKNRPVAAGGEIQAASKNADLLLPQVHEPAVSVSENAVPVRKEGTAQIPIPDEPPHSSSWWVYLVIFAVACGAVTTGLILFKRHQDRKAAEEAIHRRAQIARLKAKHSNMTPPPRRGGDNVGARAIRVRPRRLPPRRITWSGPCPPTSKRIRHRRRRIDFCIDRYEFPNRRGATPATAVDEEEAQRKCAEHGKRLCTRKEWTRACGGRRGRLYAYGKRYRPDLCVTADDKGRKRRPQPTGSRPDCTSPEGVLDLNGNMAEWVAGGQLLGGSAAKPGTKTSCESDAGSGGTAYNGFRCCATPKKR